MLLRMKADIVENNEKNSKYFANLEKKASERKLITKLNINGKSVTDQSSIRNEQKLFYQTLYSKHKCKESTQPFFDTDMIKLKNILCSQIAYNFFL